MTPAVLVARLQARGVTLQPVGETLKVRPVSKVTPEELEVLRQNKTEVLALLTASAAVSGRRPTLALDPATIGEVLGAQPDPRDLAIIRFDVMAAVRAIEAGIRTGVLPPRRLIRGRPLADWLDLDDIARLLRAAR